MKGLVGYTERTLIIKDRIVDGEDLSGIMHIHVLVEAGPHPGLVTFVPL